MTLKEIIIEYMKKHGHDKIEWAGDADGCGCHIDDLFPCGDPNLDECYTCKNKLPKDTP